MKQGATSLIPTLEGSVFTDNAWSALGVGWLGACIVLSGSPVAASSLTLLDGGAINRSESFAMLTGSRLGASFVVLVVGVIYALRRDAGRTRAAVDRRATRCRSRRSPTCPARRSAGGSSRRGTSTASTSPPRPASCRSPTSCSAGLPDLLRDVVPGWSLFPIGVVVLLGAFACFDRVLPDGGLRPVRARPASPTRG